MTPKKKTSNSTTLKMERKRIVNSSNGGDAKVHVAGGKIIQGQLQIWTEHSTLISLDFRILEISKKSYNIILTT